VLVHSFVTCNHKNIFTDNCSHKGDLSVTQTFDDVFHIFQLAGMSNDRWQTDEKNEEKFKWKSIEDLQPLDITSATYMAAD
jgi:hypothetical protein